MKRKRCAEVDPVDGPAPSKPIPELPPWKAFVVQFSRDSGLDASDLSGRVEHLNTGRRVRFNTPQQLVEILRALLSEVTGKARDSA